MDLGEPRGVLGRRRTVVLCCDGAMPCYVAYEAHVAKKSRRRIYYMIVNRPKLLGDCKHAASRCKH